MSATQTPTTGSAMDAVDWRPVARPHDWPRGLPHRTHEGRMDLGDVVVKVTTWSDGERLIDDDDLHDLLGLDA